MNYRQRPKPPIPPASPPEALVLGACIDYLRLRGHFVIRVNGGAFETNRGGYVRCVDIPGVADLIGLTFDGKPLAVEVKSSTGKQSEAQKMFEKNWIYRHGVYVLARCIEDLQEAGL